jgi:acyl-CoA thioester hydrolase
VLRGGTRLLDAEVRVAALDADTFKPRAIPDALYEELKPLESKAE